MNQHLTAAILSIGDELALGQALDTNSQWLSQRLVELGITPAEHATVSDSMERTRDAILRLAAAADVVIVTGGLGPTADDLTRASLSAAMGDTLVEDAESLRQIATWFARRPRPMPELNRVQALRPSRGAALPNSAGTAPGLRGTVRSGDRDVEVFCLPGPPREMRPMWEEHVRPALRPGRIVRTRALLTLGLGESDIATKLGAMMERTHTPLVGTTASKGVVAVRIRHEGPAGRTDAAAVQEGERATAEIERVVRERLGPVVFGVDDQTLAGAVLDLLKSRGQRLTTIESCTGGLLGASLTEVPGSSAAYLGGWVTYSNEGKQSEVGVPATLFGPGAPGAVSREVAEAMARGGLERSEKWGSAADWSLSITGVAGPDGGTADKPVGTVWISLAWRGANAGVESRRFAFAGERANIRDWSVQAALAMLRFRLVGTPEVKLLRQTE